MQQQNVRTKQAVVVGKSGNKSVKVAMDYLYKHPKYGKYIRRRTRLLVHDERNEAGIGDIVEIGESRPYSKNKSWRLVRVLSKAMQEQPV